MAANKRERYLALASQDAENDKLRAGGHSKTKRGLGYASYSVYAVWSKK